MTASDKIWGARSVDTGRARLANSPSYALGCDFRMVLKPILHNEVTQLMRDASKSRIKVREHTDRKVDSPHRQAGKGQFGPVGMKGLARLQKLLMFEDDKSHRLIGIG
jgi:hypothetical protein